MLPPGPSIPVSGCPGQRGELHSGLAPSTDTVGDCYDNAVIESFWGRTQTELLNRRRWHTRPELADAILEYLEIFHNRQRRHSALDMFTPIEFELRRPPRPPSPRRCDGRKRGDQ
ncbi:integrase core domain-containing protein [Streptomyces sp. QTS137]